MALKKTERMNFLGENAQEIKRLQDNVSRVVDPMTEIPLLDGRLIGPITLTNTFSPVSHGLGRPYLGYLTVRVGNANVVSEDYSWTQKATSARLRCSSGTAVVYLWVF